MSKQNKPEDMPILNLHLGNTSRFEASRFLDTPETISAFLAETMKEHDPEVMMQAIAEVAKARGVNAERDARTTWPVGGYIDG